MSEEDEEYECTCDHNRCDDCNPGLSHAEFRASRLDAWKCAASALKESEMSYGPEDVMVLAGYLEGIGENLDDD